MDGAAAVFFPPCADVARVHAGAQVAALTGGQYQIIQSQLREIGRQTASACLPAHNLHIIRSRQFFQNFIGKCLGKKLVLCDFANGMKLSIQQNAQNAKGIVGLFRNDQAVPPPLSGIFCPCNDLSDISDDNYTIAIWSKNVKFSGGLPQKFVASHKLCPQFMLKKTFGHVNTARKISCNIVWNIVP